MSTDACSHRSTLFVPFKGFKFRNSSHLVPSILGVTAIRRYISSAQQQQPKPRLSKIPLENSLEMPKSTRVKTGLGKLRTRSECRHISHHSHVWALGQVWPKPTQNGPRHIKHGLQMVPLHPSVMLKGLFLPSLPDCAGFAAACVHLSCFMWLGSSLSHNYGLLCSSVTSHVVVNVQQ